MPSDNPEKAIEEPVFDSALKKKKKKKSVAFSEDVLDQEAEKTTTSKDDASKPEKEDEDVDSMFSDLKKKKKKKKSEKIVEEGAASEAPELHEPMEELSLKKKKKKKSLSENEEDGGSVEEAASPAIGDMDIDDEEDDKDQIFGDEEESGKSESSGATSVVDFKAIEKSWQESDRDYTYNELLSRVFYIIRQNNPEYSGEKRKYVMTVPKVAREGTKKTVFSNIVDICNRMQRSPEHLIAYIFAELGTQGSVDGSQRLVIKGRFQPKQIENVLKHYIQEYVTCKTCRSPDTSLKKENKLFFLQCASCGSSRAVSAIKSGFKAQTEKRKLTRQQ